MRGNHSQDARESQSGCEEITVKVRGNHSQGARESQSPALRVRGNHSRRFLPRRRTRSHAAFKARVRGKHSRGFRRRSAKAASREKAFSDQGGGSEGPVWQCFRSIGYQGARESQSSAVRVRGNHSQGARKSQLKLPLSWQLLRVLLVEHFKACQFLLASGHQSY